MRPRLLLDLGNTRLKWALAEPAAADARVSSWRLGPVQALAHAGPDFLPALQSALRALPEVESVHCVAVTAETTFEAVRRCVEEHVRSLQPFLWRARTEASAAAPDGRRLVCAYPHPAHLGTDRWLSLRGALTVARTPLLVANAGTALTLDAVDADCRHLGGLILAGVSGMREGLLARAPHLQVDARSPGPAEFWADDTASAVGLAPWQAAAGLIERTVRRMQRETGHTPALLLAGGDAEALQPLLDQEVLLQPHLVLKGLLQATMDT